VRYLKAEPPEYPRASKRLKETGSVVVRVWIDEGGAPQSVQVGKSSGYPRLDEAAVDAVRKFRFEPYTENGRPTAGWALIPLNFDLEK
jgi:protein TonB